MEIAPQLIFSLHTHATIKVTWRWRGAPAHVATEMSSKHAQTRQEMPEDDMPRCFHTPRHTATLSFTEYH